MLLNGLHVEQKIDDYFDDDNVLRGAVAPL